MQTDEEVIDRVIEAEGGFVDNPADRGRATKYGITRAKLAEWRGRPVSDADVAALTLEEARRIYRRMLEDLGAAEIASPHLRWLLLDIVTNHGPGNGVRILQRALGVKVDGVFGRITRAALADSSPAHLFRELGAARLEFTGRIISGNLKDDDRDGIPDHTEFAAGWLNRQAKFWRETP